MSHIFRPAAPADLPILESLYADARRFMAEAGNPGQWTGGYPSRGQISADIAAGKLYLCCEGAEILAAFYYDQGPEPEPCYRVIEGAWGRGGPYGVLHRVAVAPGAHGRGVAAECFAWCFARCGHLRIDTHEKNRPMQRALLKNVFVRCGTIRLENGEPRWAYEK